MIDTESLIAQAVALARPFTPSSEVTTASVAAAILSGSGMVYTGVCIDTQCSLGFCAEHAAVAEMLKARESHVKAMVAVTEDREIMTPCGRCRELLWQLDSRNEDAQVIVAPDRTIRLAELLPRRSRVVSSPPSTLT